MIFELVETGLAWLGGGVLVAAAVVGVVRLVEREHIETRRARARR